MNILLVGSDLSNRGAEAMTRVVEQELSARIDEPITFSTAHSQLVGGNPAQAAEAGYPVLQPPMNSSAWNVRVLARHVANEPLSTLGLLNDRGSLYYAEDVAEHVDAVIDISGYLYADQRGVDGARRMVRLMEATRRHGAPYLFMPQTWGPFTNSHLKELCRRGCQQAALAIARDSQSRHHLAEILQKPVDEVPLSPDIAFLFQPASDEEGRTALQQLGVQVQEPIVVIAPNMRVYERTDGIGSNNEYMRTLYEAASALRERGIQIVLLPHEIRRSETRKADDRLLCDILSLMLGRENVFPALGVYSSATLKAMIGQSDLVIGSRFHSLVAALSQGVPSVALGWAHKYVELLGDFGQEDLVIDRSQLSEQQFVEMVTAAWEKREASAATIESHLPAVKERVSEVFDRAAFLLRR